MKLLVIQTAFIGDAILATDLLEELYARHPQASIDVLVRKGNEGLFAAHPFLNAVLVWDKKTSKYKHLFALSKQIRKNNYDAVYNLQRFGASGFLTMRSKAKARIGFDKNPFAFAYTKKVPHNIGNGQHEVERNLSLLEGKSVRKAIRPRLYPSQADKERIEEYTATPFYTVAPTSVWFTKQFPLERWVELIDLLPYDCAVFVLGGPTDAVAGKSILEQVEHPKVQVLAPTLNLLQSAALMQHAKMNFVNDSAPQHLASSMNAPVTTLYCSTVPEFGFGPLSENSTVLQTTTPLECRPCGLHGHKECPKRHFNCAKQIDLSKIGH